MSEETPSVEELKERLKVEIPVEEEPTKADAGADVVEEFKNLGRQFAETLQTAWNSDERVRIETEIREGMQSFAKEVDRVFQDAKDSPAADRVRTEAVDAKTKFENSDIGDRTRKGIVQGLSWLSKELGSLAEKFTPPEKPVEDVEVEE